MGEGQKFGVAPNVWRPLRDALTADRLLQGVVVVSDFQGRETLVADGAGLISPGPSAFAASQFVMRHFATRFLESVEFQSLRTMQLEVDETLKL